MEEAANAQNTWLTQFVLGASSALPVVPALKATVTITSPFKTIYTVYSKLGSTERYNLYQCTFKDDQFALLKIAKDKENNGYLDREGLILRLLFDRALEVESKNTGSKPFNYQLFFPGLVESFICKTQADRRVNIVGFPEEIQDKKQLVPISNLRDVERVRVDPKTSVWIIGKWLKVLAFAHDQGIANGGNTGSNLLIEKDEHGVILFDWTGATDYQENGVPTSVCRSEIMEIGQWAFQILGGDSQKGTLPEDKQLTDSQYADFLMKMAHGEFFNAGATLDQFYKLAHGKWPPKFHDFTVYPL